MLGKRNTIIVVAIAFSLALAVTYALPNFVKPVLAGATLSLCQLVGCTSSPGVQSPLEPLEVNIVSLENPEAFKTIIAEKEFVNAFDNNKFILASRDINTVIEIFETVTPPTAPGQPVGFTTAKKVEEIVCDKIFIPTAINPTPTPSIRCQPLDVNLPGVPLSPTVNCSPVTLNDPIAMSTAVKDLKFKIPTPSGTTTIHLSVIKTVKVEKEVLNCNPAGSTAGGPVFEIFVIEEIIEQPLTTAPVQKIFENVVCEKDPTEGLIKGCAITSSSQSQPLILVGAPPLTID